MFSAMRKYDYNVRMKSSVCQTELNLQERSQADTGELFCRILKERINDRYTYHIYFREWMTALRISMTVLRLAALAYENGTESYCRDAPLQYSRRV